MDFTPRDYPSNLGIADLTADQKAWRVVSSDFLTALDDCFSRDPELAAHSLRFYRNEARSGRWGPVGD